MTALREQVARALYCADEGIDAAANVAHVNCWFGPDATGDGTWPDDYRRMATAAIRVVLEALRAPEVLEAAAIAAWIEYATGDDRDDSFVDEPSDRERAMSDWIEYPEVCTHIGANGFRACAKAAFATAIRQLGGDGE